MPTHHLTCTPARPAGVAAFEPRWRTGTAVALARGIVADSAFDRLPILADALEEAGCDDPVTLRHCRECGRHTAKCWVLADVLDRPPVADPPRMTDAEVRREVEEITGRRVVLSSDPDWRPGWRTWGWRLLPLVIGGLVLGAAWAGIGATPSKPYNNTFPTGLAPVAPGPR